MEKPTGKEHVRWCFCLPRNLAWGASTV